MKHKSIQFPDPFVVRRIDSDIFKNPKLLPTVPMSDEPVTWKTTRSFELRNASRISDGSNTSKVMPLSSNRSEMTAAERVVHGKLSKINRLINSIRSQYSSDAWSTRASSRQSNASRIPTASHTRRKSDSQRRSLFRKQSVINDQFHNTDFITGSLQPIRHPPLVENPYRMRFNSQYEKAYRKLFK